MLTIDNRLESAADRLLDSKRRGSLVEPNALVAWLDAHPADVQRLAYGASAEKLVVLATHNPYAKWLSTPDLDWTHALSSALSTEQSARYLGSVSVACCFTHDNAAFRASCPVKLT